MRKLHDYASELKALDEKAKQLKDRQTRQLGELVIATGASDLDVEVLAGALIDAAGRDDRDIVEGWRSRGTTFLHSKRRNAARGPQSRARNAASRDGDTQPPAGEAGAS